MPKTIIRLAAGRHTFSETEQAMVSRGGTHVGAELRVSLFSYSFRTDWVGFLCWENDQAFMAGAVSPTRVARKDEVGDLILITYAPARPFAERHLYRRTDAHDPLFRMGRGQSDARSMGLEGTPRVRGRGGQQDRRGPHSSRERWERNVEARGGEDCRGDRLVRLDCDLGTGIGQDREFLGGREEEECVVRPGAIDVDTKIC
jgi:hypothetical protein